MTDIWKVLAYLWGVRSDYRLDEIAPAGVACKVCWDHNVCAECLGKYPARCPAECGNGTCPACRGVPAGA